MQYYEHNSLITNLNENMEETMKDIRDVIFKDIANQEFQAMLIPEREGCISGIFSALNHADEIGVELEFYYKEGDWIEKEKPIGRIIATPKNMAIAEEKIIGSLAKFSGIATAAKKAVELSEGKVQIVSGAWKKMPSCIKNGIRKAIVAGGASFRITQDAMIYLDKNYIKLLGSIPKTLDTVKEFTDHTKVVQIKGKQFTIEEETKQALENGCTLLMVDTGNVDDVILCSKTVRFMGLRDQVKIAFAGEIKLSQIKEMTKYDIDVLDIGKEIIDAPLLDIKLDVI